MLRSVLARRARVGTDPVGRISTAWTWMKGSDEKSMLWGVLDTMIPGNGQVLVPGERYIHGQPFSSTGKTSTESWMTTERSLFEKYTKQHHLLRLAKVMRHEMAQEEMDNLEAHLPISVGEYEYFIESHGKFPRIYRMPREGEGEDQEIVFDTNELVALFHQDDLELCALKISRQSDKLLLLVLVGGRSRVVVRDIEAHETIIQDHIHNAMNIEYDRNGTIYYTCPDNLGRPSKVFAVQARSLEQLKERPVPNLLFEDTDERNFVGIQRTKDWQYICINSTSKTSTEVRIVDPVMEDLLLVKEREMHCEYVVEHAHGHLVIMSNHGDLMQNNLFLAKIERRGDSLRIGEWTSVPHCVPREEAFLTDVTVNEYACTLLEKTPSGLPRMRALPFYTVQDDEMTFGPSYHIPLPEWALDVQLGSNEDFASTRVEFELQSPILPPIHLEWDLKTKEICSKVSTEVSLEHAKMKLEHYTAIRTLLKSDKGHAIPLTLAYRNNAQNPSKCLFVAYGAYGETLNMGYQSSIFPLLNRGWKVVFVHIRGGGEKGRAWYHAGRMPTKVNSETDLYECIKKLTEKGIVHFNRAAVMTFSAGAIPVCGVLNMYPNLGIKAVVMDSPFVDVLDSMLDNSHPLTAHEQDEFGSPHDGISTEQVARICPTSSLQDHEYPSMLISTGEVDRHVNVQGIVKYINALRTKNTNDDAHILLWPGAFKNHLPEGDEVMSTKSLQFAFLEDQMST